MAIQPATAHLQGKDAQAFSSDRGAVKWAISPRIGKLDRDPDQVFASCVYTAPPKFTIWLSRQIVLSAVDEKNGSVGSVNIFLDSAPTWIFFLAALYLVTFALLVSFVIKTWPPSPVAPWLEVDPVTVTIAPGMTQQFDASVRHAVDPSVSWSASEGVITPTGLFTAPNEVGNMSRIVVTAVSNSDRTITRSALVLMDSIGLAVQPSVVSLGPGETKSFRVLQTSEASAGSRLPVGLTPGGLKPGGLKPGGLKPGGLAPGALSWLASDSLLIVRPNQDGTGTDVQAPTQFKGTKHIILTVSDKATPMRQATAVLNLSADQTQDDQSPDKHLLELVMMVGGLGALIGASRSLGNFVGNNEFVPRWALFYIFRPTFGAGLAMLVFFGYRIGAISTGVKPAASADPLTASFVAGMVGLFADTVLQKLKDVITALFPTQDQRKDKIATTKADAPSIELIELSATKQRMTIKGKSFAMGAKVFLNGKDRPLSFISANELLVVLEAADVNDVVVTVINPDKQTSAEFSAKIVPQLLRDT